MQESYEGRENLPVKKEHWFKNTRAVCKWKELGLDVVAHPFNLSTWKAAGSLPAWYIVKPCLKKRKERKGGNLENHGQSY